MSKKKKGNSLLPVKGDSPFEVIRKFIFLLSAGVFVVCSFLIGKYFWDNHQNDLKNEQMRNVKLAAEAAVETTEAVMEEETHDYYDLLPSQKALLEQNLDN